MAECYSNCLQVRYDDWISGGLRDARSTQTHAHMHAFTDARTRFGTPSPTTCIKCLFRHALSTKSIAHIDILTYTHTHAPIIPTHSHGEDKVSPIETKTPVTVFCVWEAQRGVGGRRRTSGRWERERERMKGLGKRDEGGEKLWKGEVGGRKAWGMEK